MVCHGKGEVSILGPTNKVPQDENKTKRIHMAVGYSHVILVIPRDKTVHLKTQWWLLQSGAHMEDGLVDDQQYLKEDHSCLKMPNILSEVIEHNCNAWILADNSQH